MGKASVAVVSVLDVLRGKVLRNAGKVAGMICSLPDVLHENFYLCTIMIMIFRLID